MNRFFRVGLLALLIGWACAGDPPAPLGDTGARGPARAQVWNARRARRLPVPVVGRLAVDWRRGPHDRMVVGTAGLARGPAHGPFTRMLFVSPGRAQDLRFLTAVYAPFVERRYRGELLFRGAGQTVAAPAERRMIAEWARLVEREATSGDLAGSSALALSWQAGEGTGEPCTALRVLLSGEVAALCKGRPVRARLTAEALAWLYGLYDRLRPFQEVGAGERSGRLIFAGRGPRPATPDERALAGGLALALDRELAVGFVARSAAPPRRGGGESLPAGRPAAAARLLRPATLPPEPVAPAVLAPAEPPPVEVDDAAETGRQPA